MKIQVIGAGQAGMKAVIAAIENEVLTQSQVLFINSTEKDIPIEYRPSSIIFDKNNLGCAKSRKRAEELIMNEFATGTIANTLASWVLPTTDAIVLCCSTDGGSGSGSVPVLADYISTQLGKRVHIFGFDGFDSDVVGLRNRVEFLKKLDESYTIEIVCNSKFLKEANGDITKAEAAANRNFAIRLSILQGLVIEESDHNIDEADLLNVCTMQGFMNIEYREFDRIKNQTEFNALIHDICDNTKSFDVLSPTQKKMAVIINVNVTDTGSIDWTFKELKERFGAAINVYTHLQHKSTAEFIAIINAGMNMPVEAIDNIYNKYQEEKSKVAKTPDSFWSSDRYDLDDDDDNLFGENTKKKSTFFNNSVTKFQNVKKKVKSVEEDY